MARSAERMSLEELKALVAEREKSEGIYLKVRAEIDALCKKYGVELWDVIGKTKGVTKAAATASPKWRNPDNPSETWVGRGRPPKQWVALLTKANVKVDDASAVKAYLRKKGFEIPEAKGQKSAHPANK